MMSLQAATRMSESAIGWHGHVEASHSMAWALNVTDLAECSLNCFLHVTRNPFEMIVSGYLYHKARAEDWLLMPFAKMGETADQTINVVQDLESMAHVFNSSQTVDWLPRAHLDETYAEYLERLDVATGLSAEYLWASHSSLASTLFTNSFIAETHNCSINVCYNEFFSDCHAAWRKVLRAWAIPEPTYSRLLTGAKDSCPVKSAAAKEHGSEHQAASSSVDHEPVNAMVLRLRNLDKLRFNGALAKLEAQLQCPVSGKYATPSA